MNQHLSSEQIERHMAGQATADEQRHASECLECRTELSRMQSTLELYRDSVRQWSDRQSRPELRAWRPSERSRWFDMQVWRLGMVVTAMVVLAVVPVYRNASARMRAAELARQDALLLERVDAELSRTVPASMEPLLKLVSSSESSRGERSGGVR